jgi:hypothetical protein
LALRRSRICSQYISRTLTLIWSTISADRELDLANNSSSARVFTP